MMLTSYAHFVLTVESDCNAVGYFTTDQISVVDGNCAWGYDPDDIESNDGSKFSHASIAAH